MATISLIHGPNLNLLGSREPDVYGTTTLAEINREMATHAQMDGHSLNAMQSNNESDLIDRVHQAYQDDTQFIIINPGAYTHTSIALRDAFLSVKIPFIEVHLSNVYARENFRHTSYLSDIAAGVIGGLGPYGYQLALLAAKNWLNAQTNH